MQLVATKKELAEALKNLEDTIYKLGILSWLYYWNVAIYPFVGTPEKSIPKFDKFVTKFDELTSQYWRFREKLREVIP